MELERRWWDEVQLQCQQRAQKHQIDAHSPFQVLIHSVTDFLKTGISSWQHIPQPMKVRKGQELCALNCVFEMNTHTAYHSQP